LSYVKVSQSLIKKGGRSLTLKKKNQWFDFCLTLDYWYRAKSDFESNWIISFKSCCFLFDEPPHCPAQNLFRKHSFFFFWCDLSLNVHTFTHSLLSLSLSLDSTRTKWV
jgi:hypothetical protein